MKELLHVSQLDIDGLKITQLLYTLLKCHRPSKTEVNKFIRKR